jgi:hypothetical protein
MPGNAMLNLTIDDGPRWNVQTSITGQGSVVKIDDAILWDGQNRFSQVLIAVDVENPIWDMLCITFKLTSS